jgi:hypothetical protein
MSWRGVTAVLALFGSVGCGAAAPHGNPLGAAVSAHASQTSLVPAPAVVAAACRQGSITVGLPVLCPTRWPATRAAGPPQLFWFERSTRVYLLNAFNGPNDETPHVFHLLIGGQSRPFGRAWQTTIDPGLRVTTRTVRIPKRGGGTFVQQRPARLIGTTTVHGARAILLREPPYPQGGLQGGHVLVLWNQGSHGYLISVHGLMLSSSALVAIAEAMADSARS